jgi:hypothetical protein
MQGGLKFLCDTKNVTFWEASEPRGPGATLVTCGVFGCHVRVTAMSRSVIPRLQNLFIPNCLAAACNGL